MRYRVLLTDRAEADVESVLKWFADQRTTNAGGRWFAQLMNKLDTLERQPDRCSLAAESVELGQEIRELLVGRRRYRYRLLFRISGQTVHILRVRHSSQDAISREEI